jgi:hypothetical protein
MKLRPTSTLAQILAYKQINLTVVMSVPLVLTAQITNARVTNGIVALKYYLQTTPKKKYKSNPSFPFKSNCICSCWVSQLILCLHIRIKLLIKSVITCQAYRQ